MLPITIGSFFGPFLGVSFSLLAIQHTNTGIASTIMALVPIFIIPPSILLFKHKVTAREMLGTVISLSGVALFFLKRLKSNLSHIHETNITNPLKDYIRRSAKFILYIVLIFFVVLGLYPLMKYGKPLSDSMGDLLNNSRFTTMFGILMVYGMLYPMIAFTKIKRHLNGSFEQNRDKIERAFEKLEYVKTQDVPGYCFLSQKVSIRPVCAMA